MKSTVFLMTLPCALAIMACGAQTSPFHPAEEANTPPAQVDHAQALTGGPPTLLVRASYAQPNAPYWASVMALATVRTDDAGVSTGTVMFKVLATGFSCTMTRTGFGAFTVIRNAVTGNVATVTGAATCTNPTATDPLYANYQAQLTAVFATNAAGAPLSARFDLLAPDGTTGSIPVVAVTNTVSIP